MSGFAERVRAGDVHALARALSVVENRAPGAEALLAELHTSCPHTQRIGITGAPGAGKSTLVDCLASHLRQSGRSVAVLAVDPTSPFSGGAILGDRVRMQRHHDDPGVFIRSMASRGELGGLAPAVGDALTVLEASGRDTVLIETAGVGQSEVDVVQLAGTVAVVVTPSLGDDIQAAKAGIMEIADLFVLNKADQPGADELERQIQAMISIIPDGSPRPPVVRTVANRCEGIGEVVGALRGVGHRQAGVAYWRRRLLDRIGSEVQRVLVTNPPLVSDLDRAAEAVAAGTLNPYTYVQEVLDRLQEQWKS